MRSSPEGLRKIMEQLRSVHPELLDVALPPLKPPSDDVTYGDMDPWQQSVEKRLESLDGRAQRLEQTASDIRVDVSSMKATVAELPRKGFIVTATCSALILIAAISAFVQWVLAAHAH